MNIQAAKKAAMATFAILGITAAVLAFAGGWIAVTVVYPIIGIAGLILSLAVGIFVLIYYIEK